MQRKPVGRTSVSDKPTWLGSESCSLSEFRVSLESLPDTDTYPLSDSIEEKIPLYGADTIARAVSDEQLCFDLMAEWNQIFADGAGVVCIKNAYSDLSLLDHVTDQLLRIIETEKAEKTSDGGDHFAAAGANDRLWNAHEKLCVAAPELFARYNANPLIPIVSQAWLGPYYQGTAQVNVVHPGGKAQTCHRDYHMGFQDAEILAKYPAPIHKMTQALTLQGAIAHSDMPVESGPTKLLPGSQSFLPGYFAVHQAEFRDHFENHFVQLPLDKGDAVFFNPAVFHAAGDNRTTDVHRFANLLQIGSGYGRSIEIVDRVRMCKAVYPTLLKLLSENALQPHELQAILNACAEGYPFPTNLDFDSPLGGMIPQSQLQLIQQALSEDWSIEKFANSLDDQLSLRRSH